MKMLPKLLTPLCALALTATVAQAQFYKLHNADFAGEAIGQYTTTLTTGNTGIKQNTTNSFGGVFSVRDHPVAWAGVEVNFGYTEFTEYYTAPTYTAKPHTDMYEATGAYLFHPHFRNLQPFIAIGGGGVDFVPNRGNNQWRGAGLVELGLDIPTSNPHFGFRVQGRSLIYRAPNYGQPNLGTKNWVATDEPSAGVYLRY